MLHKLNIKPREKQKGAFYASDYGKSMLELYLGFKNVPQTNPTRWQDTLRMGAGKGAEEAMLRVLKDSGIVAEDYTQEEQGRIDVTKGGFTIHGYVDAITTTGEPIEIKTINNKNAFDISKYEAGEPRESYVGQLAIYMDCLGKDKGYLFVSSIDGLNTFWFECNKIDKLTYKCGNVVINLGDKYRQWKNLNDNHIQKDIMPDVYEIRYKHPISELDWKSLSKDTIAKMRGNKKVYGDWQVSYSSWKDHIISLQKETAGYTDEELKVINEKTTGYTTWK